MPDFSDDFVSPASDTRQDGSLNISSAFSEVEAKYDDKNYRVTSEDWQLIKKCFDYSVEDIYFYEKKEIIVLLKLAHIIDFFEENTDITAEMAPVINASPAFFDNLIMRYGNMYGGELTYDIVARYKGWLRGFLDKVDALRATAQAEGFGESPPEPHQTSGPEEKTDHKKIDGASAFGGSVFD